MANRLLALSLALVAGLVLWLSLGTDSPPVGPTPDAPAETAPDPEEARSNRPGARSSLVAASDDQASETVETTEGRETEPRPEPGAAAEVTAVVVDGNNKVVAGANVSLRRLTLDAPVIERTAVTGANGRFVVTDVLGGERFSLSIDGGDSGQLERWLRQTPVPGERLDLGTLKLWPTRTLTGRVVETDGSPVAGASVRFSTLPTSTLAAAPVHRARPENPIAALFDVVPTPVLRWSERMDQLDRSLEPRRTRTDASGVFKLQLPDGTSGQILVATEEGRSAIRTVDSDPDATLPDIQLTPMVSASIRVVDRNGNPALGAELQLAPVDGLAPFRVPTGVLTVAEDGSVPLDQFPTPRAVPLVRTTSEHPWSVLPETDVAGSTLTLPESAALTLQFDRALALPRPDDVDIYQGSGPVMAQLIALGAVQRLQAAPVASTAAASLRYEDLPLGTYTVRIRSEGAAEWIGVVELEADRTIQINRTPSRSLTVRVLDPANTAIEGVEVSLYAPSSDPATRPTVLRARTNRDGEVEWTDAPSGAVQVGARSQLHGRALAVAPPGTDSIELRLSGTGTLEGELTEVTDPTAWVIEIVPAVDPAVAALGGLPISAAVWAPGSMTTRAEEDGSFRFAFVPSGEVRVEARQVAGPDGGVAALIGRSLAAAEASAETTILTNATQRVLLRPEAGNDPNALGARITGTVRIDDQKTAGLMIVIELPDQERPRTTRTDAEGRFDLGMVPAGTHEVFVYDLSSSSRFDNQPHLLWRSRVTVGVATDQDLAVGVTTGSIAGRVLSASGDPLARQFVLVEGILDLPPPPADGSIETRTILVTDAEGAFEAKGLPPGRWRIRLRPAGPDDPGQRIEDLVLTAGGRIDNLELRQPR